MLVPHEHYSNRLQQKVLKGLSKATLFIGVRGSGKAWEGLEGQICLKIAENKTEGQISPKLIQNQNLLMWQLGKSRVQSHIEELIVSLFEGVPGSPAKGQVKLPLNGIPMINVNGKNHGFKTIVFYMYFKEGLPKACERPSKA
jgi:hypothetical protein